MKLTYFKGDVPNFGDELNAYMWPKILPANFLDENPNELFVGIGSILFDNYPKSSKKYVLGSGYGGYTAAPDLNDGSWETIFVRGPRTARLLNLPPNSAICDSAILLRAIELPKAGEARDVAFMPHFDSLKRGNWLKVCREAGLKMIDPSDPVDKILYEIRSSRMLITEAMHGAIVADAFRVPWLAVMPSDPGHHMKWFDWAESLHLTLRRHKLWPSNIMEAYVQMTGKSVIRGRVWNASQAPIAKPFNDIMSHLAAERLAKLMTFEPSLSSDININDVTERAFIALKQFTNRIQTVAKTPQ